MRTAHPVGVRDMSSHHEALPDFPRGELGQELDSGAGSMRAVESVDDAVHMVQR